ncbi:MAG: NAD(P)H-dependent oxidoreductase subunit E, partial [Phycisphaerae bacterium]
MTVTATNQATRFASPEALAAYRDGLRAERDPRTPCVMVCGGTGCRANGALDVAEAFRRALAERDLDRRVRMRVSGCHGFCEQGPLVVLQPEDLLYTRVTPDDVEEILDTSVVGSGIVERLTYTNPATNERVPHQSDIPFYAEQQRVALGHSGRIDPASLDDYLAAGGYASLAKVLTAMDPDEVIETVTRSGLRGRGGGGFPTGRKWRSCRDAEETPKYVLCNGDEGDPGAFMDRSIMEGDPHAVLEGMAIGAYAIGSDRGYIYVRQEYPLAVEHLAPAIRQAEEAGLLGENILGTDFSFTVRINRGAGAFVCGESTALMASLEGFAGEPRVKHIHTTEKGLFDKPTNLNNVETWANVPVIIEKGAEWFAGLGSETSTGTKVFSLVGKVANTGLVEVPMGMPLRKIIDDIGGGVAGGRPFKAVQTGG